MFIRHTYSHKYSLNDLYPFAPLAKHLRTPSQSFPHTPIHRHLNLTLQTHSSTLPQPTHTRTHTALHPKTWPFLDSAFSHSRTPPHPIPFPQFCPEATMPPPDRPKPIRTSFMPLVSLFIHPQTGIIPTRFPHPGSADRGQSQEEIFMFQELDFEQDGGSQGLWPQGREGKWQ